MNFPQTFYFPYNELDVAGLKPGEIGELTIKVEVMSVDKEGVSFEKHGSVVVSKPFSEVSLEEMRKRIGAVEDEEEPVGVDRSTD